MSETNSYRTILRSSAIMGSASVVNIVVGLVRMKVAAVLLGPAGIGLIGLLQNLMQTASTVSAVGFGSAGTRQIAEAAAGERDANVATARRALFWGTLFLSVVGGALFFLMREQLATWLLGDIVHADDLGWLALGVVFTVAAGSQGALLQGLRRIGDVAKVQIVSAIFATIIGVAVLFAWGENGIVPFLIAAPLASFVVGHWFVAKLERIPAGQSPLPSLILQWRTLAGLGVAFMLSGLVASFGLLASRSVIQHQLGPDELGQFQASWAISMTYLGFVLSAMGADYYPRLTGTIRDHGAATRLVNEQIEVALLLGGPALIAMMALAPLVVRLLYSSEFAVAGDILRWQVMGDILKIASWPLGYVLLAAGAGKTYIASESIGIGVFVLGIWLAVPLLGITATGVSFVAMYAIYLPLVFWLARRHIGFRWQAGILGRMALLILAAGTIFFVSHHSELAAGLVGIVLASVFGLHGLARLGSMAELSGVPGKLARLSSRAINLTGMRLG